MDANGQDSAPIGSANHLKVVTARSAPVDFCANDSATRCALHLQFETCFDMTWIELKPNPLRSTVLGGGKRSATRRKNRSVKSCYVVDFLRHRNERKREHMQYGWIAVGIVPTNNRQ